MPLRCGASHPSNLVRLETACRTGRSDCPVILSLQNNLVEAQAHSRLAMLRQAFAGKAASPSWHPAYRSDLCLPSARIVGGTSGLRPVVRMPAAPLATFAACALDCLDTSGPSVNAKQEGIP